MLELADRHFEHVSRERRSAGIWQTVVAVFRSAAAQARMAISLTEDASIFRDDAIWFAGATKGLYNGEAIANGATERAIQRTDHVKGLINDRRTRLMAFRNELGQHIVPQLRKAIDSYLSACAELFEALEEFKWGLLEFEASQSRISTGYFAQTPEELVAVFERLKSDA